MVTSPPEPPLFAKAIMVAGPALLLGVFVWACWSLWCRGVADARASTRRHRVATGCCARCGYNVVATPHRCPECGFQVGRDPDDATYAAEGELDFQLLSDGLGVAEAEPAMPPAPPDAAAATTHVYATADGWAAELAVALLNRRGVWSVRRRRREDADTRVERPYQVWVQEADADRARAALGQYRRKTPPHPG